MKILTFALIFSIAIWPVSPSWALSNGTNTSTSTSTRTSTGTSTSTDTKCSESGETYGGGSFSACTKTKNNTQENTQEDTKDLNDSGAQQSMMLGMMATAAGAAMVAAGMACSCPGPNPGLIAAGAALIAAGMMGMSAAGNMANNAGKAGYNDYKMGDLTPGVTPGTKTTDPGTVGGIKIDDSFTRTGKSGLVFDDFENKTGIDRDTLTNGLQSGRSVADILADSKAAKKNGFDADKIAASINGASAMGADEVMGQLGLTPEELAAMANKNAGMGEEGALALATGGSRSPASSSSTGLDGFGAAANAPATLGGESALNGLSADVQNALDRNGITDLSIFQMVHRKYKTKTPMMFGETSRKPTSITDNPFSNLGNGGKIEF